MKEAKRESWFVVRLRGAFRRLMRVYFRDVEVAGELPSASTTARLFAANHVNGLIDPMLVLTTTPCAISPLGKAPLWKIPILASILDAVDAVPVERKRDNPNKSGDANRAMFDRVARHFAAGGNVLIFPEGTSHNEPHLLPTRSGAAHMLALAFEQGTTGLTFQTVGLEFEARDTFRSRALLIYGPVRNIDEIAASAPAEKGALAESIKDALENDLRALLFATTAWEDRYLVARVAELFANDERDRSIARFFDLAKTVIARRDALADRTEGLRLAERIAAYFGNVTSAGFSDEEISGLPFARSKGGVSRAVALLLLLPFAIVGGVLFAIPYQLPRLFSRSATQDVVSTYKLGIGLVVFPFWFILLSVASALLAARVCPHWSAIASAPLAVALSLYAAFVWLDRDERILRRLRFFRADEKTRTRLARERDAIMRALRSLETPVATS